VALLINQSDAFLLHSNALNAQRYLATGRLMAITDDTLEAMVDHEAEGTRLSSSIEGWLNQEWVAQEVHRKMGESAKQSYISARNEGENEIMSVMLKVSEDLEANWTEFDDDAYVNAWDVGNYVADYLRDRLGGERCECSAEIFKPNE